MTQNLHISAPGLVLRLLTFALLLALAAFSQTETATLTGTITDASGAVVADASVQVTNVETGITIKAASNRSGLYVVPNLHPGHYRVIVEKEGFKQMVLTELILNVQDIASRNFQMQLGTTSESITVTAEGLNVNTTDASVSTVVDRQFAENLPLNGRSFQTLIALTPGVVLTNASVRDPGQFSVNGQRASANYFMVDGVGANVGISGVGLPSQGAAGSVPGFTVWGGTNNLVSVDAMQEFRMQTSTYAPEYGRSPGAQVSIVTRSGTNQLHGTLFEYLRNDVLDANEWFSNQKGLPKARERQNDFGGVLGGPIRKNRTFFFLSYEGLRLRLPNTGVSTVPSLAARQSASAAIKPILAPYPLPNGRNLANGVAEFNATYSDPATLNATSIRIDHLVRSRMTLFGRYNHSPSDLSQRGAAGAETLNDLFPMHNETDTVTMGSTWSLTNATTHDFRLNYSRFEGSSKFVLDDFGGAIVPSESDFFPSPFSTQDSRFTLSILSLTPSSWVFGRIADHVQNQWNLVDNMSLQKGSHALKFGADYRRLRPSFGLLRYGLAIAFSDVPSALAATPSSVFVTFARPNAALFHNLGAFAQDTWKVTPRLTLTYGVRWDTDFAPTSASGLTLLAVNQVENPATMALAPSGTPVFETRYGNFAPRVGLAYALSQAKGRETVLRGGFGVFYDLATMQFSDGVLQSAFPFGASKTVTTNLTYPLDPAVAAPPEISIAAPSQQTLFAFDPHLKLPHTLEWNLALERSLGSSQTISASYLGAVGRNLVQEDVLVAPNPSFAAATLIRNLATSDYHSLQLKFQRRLSRGLQVLCSYTWSHSVDSASSSSGANMFSSSLGANANRGRSDFDVRHALAGALTYDVPTPRINDVGRAILSGWSVDNLVLARSAPPVDVNTNTFGIFGGSRALVRPDLLSGVPLTIADSSVAGGRRINRAAFANPPLDPTTRLPLRQGTLGRNALEGFGATQWDVALRRQFKVTEQWGLQFRAEFFNVLNHPNFAKPEGILNSALFGQSIRTLARGLGGSPGAGFAPLYQVGGPRSIQLALKLQF